jgi:hypothetical protein
MGRLLPRFSPPEVFALELLKVQLESQELVIAELQALLQNCRNHHPLLITERQ